MMALLGIIAIGSVFMFSCGLVVGMSYERSLRRLGHSVSRDARRHAALRYAVCRYLDAEHALCQRRSGSADQIEFRAARVALAEIADWGRPVPASSGVQRTASAQEIAS